MTDSPLHLRLWFVSLVTLFLAALFLFAGWILYSRTGKSSTDFYQKLSELSLQLAVIVVIGGAVKAIADWREREKEAIAEQSKQRQEFARRAREMHVSIELAGELLRAHQSPKTYSEQLQNLIRLRFEVQDLQADLTARITNFVAEADRKASTLQKIRRTESCINVTSSYISTF